VVSVFFSCSRFKPVEPVLEFRKESVLLDTLPQGVNPDDIQFSPDGTEVVYRWKTAGGRQGFAFNGRIEQYYDEVGEFVSYTRDGSHYAYTAKRGGKSFIVFDGTEGEPFDQVADPDLAVTGRSLAYAAKSGESAFILFNGRRLENEAYELIRPPDLSPDGRRVAYEAKKKGRWHYVIDGKEGPAFDELAEGYYSRDGRSFAYAGRRGSKWVFVRDGWESREYDEVGVYPEAADADLFTARETGRAFIVFRGKEGLKYDKVGWPAVSADGKRIAYGAVRGDKSFVVLEKREGQSYDTVGRPVFSPDGREIAYDAVEGQRFLMIRNDRELADYNAMPGPVFSPAGGKLAYKAVNRDASREFAVEEGLKGKDYDDVGLLAWSPNGRHLAYAAREGDKEFIVVDGREGLPCEKVLSLVPRFSDDGKFVGANVLKGREIRWVVMSAE
jgi:Tol biopolymer transport system component